MAQRRRPGRKRAAASAADEPLQPLSSEELRRQAEARLDVLSAAALPAPAELAAAVHELRVHQIELEMQNEELRRAQLEAETLRVQYAELFFMAPVGYFTLGNRGIVGEANHTAAGLLGVERRELVGQPFSAFVLAADRDTYYRHLELLQQSEEAQSCEVRLKPVGGEPFWARLEGRSQGDAGDESRSYNLTFADVDKRVFAEEALRRRENELRIVLETVPDAVFHVDRDYRLVFANEGWVRATTTTQGKAVAIGEPVLASGYSPDVIEAWRGYYDRALGGESFAEVLTFASADGTYYTENQFSPVREADGEVSGVIVTSRDVSERRRVEGQLDDERLRFKLLVENSAEAFLMTQPDGTLLGANPAACRMFGRSEEELCRLGRAGIVDVTDPRLAAILEEGARTGSAAGEVRLLRSDRTTFPGEVSSSVYSDHLGNERSSMSIRDLSERREAEEALRKFDRLFHGNPALMAVSSVSDGRFTEVNEAFLAALGYSREEIVGHTTDELGLFIEPEQQRDVAEQIQAQGRASDCELKVLCRDGSILDGLFSGEIIESQGQQYFLTVMIDHTERKRAEKAVRASRKQLACAVDGSGVGLWDWQVQSGEETFSEHWAGILGYTLAELAPTSVETWRSRSHPDDLRRDDELLEEHFCGRSPSYSCEMRLRHKDGHWVWVLDCGKVTEWDEGGRPLRMIGTALDVSERKQVERALARSESRYRSLFEDSPVAMWEEDHAAVKARLEELLAAGVGDIESYLREHPGEYERCLGLTRTLDANAAAVALFEAASREELVARQDEVYPRGVVGSLPAFWAALLAGRRAASGEEANLTLGGGELQVLATASVAPGHEDDWGRVYLADVDVTEQRRAEQQLALAAREWQETFDAMPDSVAVFDAGSRIRRCNRATSALTGRAAEDIIGRSCYEVFHCTNNYSQGCPQLLSSASGRQETSLYEQDGKWLRVTFEPDTDESGRVSGGVHVVSDVTALKLAEEEQLRLNDELVGEGAILEAANAAITRIAATDVLTDLANRRHFYEVLESAVSLARRHGSPLAVVSLDLDGLKRVNDNAGHEAGDGVLTSFADLLAALCRAEDLPARLGGDEFSVLLPGVEIGGGRGFAERVCAAAHACAALAERGVTVSAGVAQWASGELPDDLLRRTDDALYAAKRGGGDAVSEAG